jgi:hypothetical protein
MTIRKGMNGYHLMRFFHELLFLFISSFLSFALHIKRIILCFVYSDDHHPSFIYPSLEEEDLPSSCVVDVDLISSPQPIHKDELFIEIPLEFDHPYNLEEVEIDSNPSLISLPSTVTIEPFHQLVKPHIHPTIFQTRIKDKMFKPLRLPYHLHPYPLDFLEYRPRCSGENHVIVENHLEAFEKFVDQFEIVHDDVKIRFFSKYLIKDVSVWFKGLRGDSIGSWIELCNSFLRCWGENKSLDQYLAVFYSLRRGEDEALAVFNKRFYSVYHNMLVEI